MIEYTVWLFMFCVLDGVTCDRQIKVMPDYQACIDAQRQYAIDHAHEDYLAVCKRKVEIRA